MLPGGKGSLSTILPNLEVWHSVPSGCNILTGKKEHMPILKDPRLDAWNDCLLL